MSLKTKMVVGILGAAIVGAAAFGYYVTYGNNGWNRSDFKEAVYNMCDKNSHDLPRPKVSQAEDFKKHFISKCIETVTAASEPCQVEYHFGSDSGMKCLDERTIPAYRQFAEGIVDFLLKAYPTEEGEPFFGVKDGMNNKE